MLRKVGIAQKKRAFDFDFWIIGGIFMKKFVAGVVALTIAFGGMALPAESGVFFDGASISASADWDDTVYECGDYQYTINDDGTIDIVRYYGEKEVVSIPSELDGRKVTVIGNSAFMSCKNITSIKIPDGVTHIGSNAFLSCFNLKSITIPDSVYALSTAAFGSCESLKSVTLPDGITEIEHSTFIHCKSLTSVTIPKNVTCIRSRAFSNCESLKGIYYEGSKSDWDKMSIDEYGNEYLLKATIHYGIDEIAVDKVKTTKFTCTDKAVKINWEKVNGAAGYRVYAYNAKTKKWSTAATVSASTLSFKQTGLKSGTTYKYKVKAYAKQDGKTYWGEASDTMTTTTKPAQPAIKSTSASTSAVRLNWNAVSGANGYRVVRYDANAKKWASVGTIKTTSFKETKLKGKTSYKYKVKAYRKVGGATYWSEYSAVKSVKTK